MKKNVKRFNSIILAVIMFALTVFGGIQPVSAAVMSKKKQHALYQKTMKQYAYKVKKSYKEKSKGMEDIYSCKNYKVWYVFADIDKNGIDELIMKFAPSKRGMTTIDNTSLWEQSTTIYTIKNGKVITVLDNTDVGPMSGRQPRVRIFKNRNRIDMGVPVGYETYVFCKYSNGKLYTEKGKIRMAHVYAGSSMTGREFYSYNDKKISASSYHRKYKQLTNNERGYRMKVYK